jgi:hypothetical protein
LQVPRRGWLAEEHGEPKHGQSFDSISSYTPRKQLEFS